MIYCTKNFPISEIVINFAETFTTWILILM